MILLVCGSRNITSTDFIYECLDEIFKEYDNCITRVIHGGARGVDNIAHIYCKEHHMSVKEFKPEYKKYGRKAPLIRNREMVNMCDAGIAIWDGHSTGTAHTISLLKKQDKLLRVFE